MTKRLDSIISEIRNFEGVRIVEPLTLRDSIIYGTVNVSDSNYCLDFKVEIYSQYPFQAQDVETIRFINKTLIEYNHVNSDGSICIHTMHDPILLQKLKADFLGLKEWIRTYYIGDSNDDHYEHIIVDDGFINDERHFYLFTDIDYKFKKGDYGYINYANLSEGYHKEKKVITRFVQSFKINKKIIKCEWNNIYSSAYSKEGIFVFIEDPPVKNRRFIIQNWIELEKFVDQNFFKFLYKIKQRNFNAQQNKEVIPLFIGYNINCEEIHWQCASILINNFPTYGTKDHHTKSYIGNFYNEKIIWNQTNNSSYKFFFGRGKLNISLTNSNILIIGIGAIGSIVATTLTRGGCKRIDLFDYDVKKPENVCRSEYNFFTGINSKVIDLQSSLWRISPFIDIAFNEELTKYLKCDFYNPEVRQQIESYLNQYDIIFDCTTDNDIAYILDNLETKSTIINLSITNYAKHLVCAVKPNLYSWLIDRFTELNEGEEDLYNPTGCWNPTFKASYNDINTLVQFAIKNINMMFELNKPLRHFYLNTSFDSEFNINIHQY